MLKFVWEDQCWMLTIQKITHLMVYEEPAKWQRVIISPWWSCSVWTWNYFTYFQSANSCFSFRSKRRSRDGAQYFGDRLLWPWMIFRIYCIQFMIVDRDLFRFSRKAPQTARVADLSGFLIKLDNSFSGGSAIIDLLYQHVWMSQKNSDHSTYNSWGSQTKHFIQSLAEIGMFLAQTS